MHLRSRFITPDLLALFDVQAPPAGDEPAVQVQAGPPQFDLAAALRKTWAGGADAGG
jgi:hypothetical protein